MATLAGVLALPDPFTGFGSNPSANNAVERRKRNSMGSAVCFNDGYLKVTDVWRCGYWLPNPRSCSIWRIRVAPKVASNQLGRASFIYSK